DLRPMPQYLPITLRTAAAFRTAVLLAAATVLLAPAARAQLRPLDAFDWRVLEGEGTVVVEAGGGRLGDQRASLAGTEGTLWEAGNVRAFWRTGRVVIEAGGTVRRIFGERGRFAAAEPFVTVDDDGKRADSGDYRIATAVRLTNEGAPVAALLRFGTRLPTTDNREGLDRDATDFFATLGGRMRRGPFALQAEAGVGIFGTRDPDFEQDDLLVYAVKAEYDAGIVVPSLSIVGQQVGAGHSEIRGNESLGEVRAGLRVGRREFVRAEVVRGYTDFSPGWGVLVSAGVVR
ncbi:MAG TPA: hypothetical protein VEX86_15075, partial [Longimicrobium sp.]|nr:hypothetical protein [Longimicrobium sp.]